MFTLSLSFQSNAQHDIANVKAIYMHNLTNYVQWPDNSIGDTFNMAVLIDSALYNQLRINLVDAEVQEKPIKVMMLNDLGKASEMDMIYSHHKDGFKALDLFEAIDYKPVLLATYGYDFNSTMLNFVLRDKVLKFQMNKTNMLKCGLESKNDLESIASEVSEEEWNIMVEGLRSELVEEKEKSADLESRNEELENQMLQLENEIQDLHIEIELKKQELSKISDSTARQRKIYIKLLEQEKQMAAELKKMQKISDTQNKEVELMDHVYKKTSKRLRDQRKQLRETEKQHEAVQAEMTDALRLLDNQRLVSIAIAVIALVIALLGGIAYKNYRTQKMQAIVIAEQRDKVEKQRDEIQEKSKQISLKSKEILDSINYAKRIQVAILPPLKLVKEYLADSFIYYKPKDIVAGDFYWFETIGDDIYFAAADCTGHGVPGAMVSVVCANALNRAVKEMGATEPAQILDVVRQLVVETFEKSEEEVKDGMDISFCKFNVKTLKLSFSGAHNPLYRITPLTDEAGEKTLIQNNFMLLEYKGDKQPIGKFAYEKPFTQEEVQLLKGDSIYISTDGYADQFGGPDGKKFMYKPFKRLFLSMHSDKLEDQKSMLDKSFEDWRGNEEQIDDVCVIGVRV